MNRRVPDRTRPETRGSLRVLLYCLLGFPTVLWTPGHLWARPAGSRGGKVAAPADTAGSTAGSATGSRLFPPRLSKGRFVYLPMVYYSSDRGFGLGGEVFRLFRWPDPASPRASDIRLKGRITTKGQGEAEITSNLRWGEGRYYVKMKLGYRTLAQRFYGIGPGTPAGDEEVYQPQRVQAYVEVFRRLFSEMKIGLRYEFEQVRLLGVEADGLLDTGDISGTAGHSILGAGLLADWDTRDDKFHPTSGSRHQLFYIFFDDELGSDYDFHNYHLDLRKYLLISHGEVLATQFFIFGTNREVPFWRLAAMGGRAHTRGYRRGRYVDRVLVAFQLEYRIPLWSRLGVAVFGGLGDVGSTLRTLQIEHMKPSVGAGLRLTTSATDGVRARSDVAVGQNSARLYLSLDEAF